MARITSDERPDLMDKGDQLTFLANSDPCYLRHPNVLTYHRLEQNRQAKLGLGMNRIVKHFNVTRTVSGSDKAHVFDIPVAENKCNSNGKEYPSMELFSKGPNTWAPFYTIYKNVCGYHFNPKTDHRRAVNGVPPSNLVAWRTNATETTMNI